MSLETSSPLPSSGPPATLGSASSGRVRSHVPGHVLGDRRVDVAGVALALCLAVAAGVHGTLLPAHLESPLLGAGFALTTAFQLVAAVLVLSRPGPRLLEAIAIGNAAVLAVWVASRVGGLPVAPDAWVPEPVGLVDTLVAGYELAAIALALGRRFAHRRAGSVMWLRHIGTGATWLAGSLGVFVLALAAAHENHGPSDRDHLAGHLVHAGLLAGAVAIVPLVGRCSRALGRR